jgi:hypothetical protein
MGTVGRADPHKRRRGVYEAKNEKKSFANLMKPHLTLLNPVSVEKRF